jgi:hypothetical protein
LLVLAVILNEVKDPEEFDPPESSEPFSRGFSRRCLFLTHHRKQISSEEVRPHANSAAQKPTDTLTKMNLRIAAIRSGFDPVRKLSSGSFQRWLETPLSCPKCDATYNLAVDWDQSNDRWFSETSRPLITLLKKAIMMGHTTNHRVTHFETEGVIVESVTAPEL